MAPTTATAAAPDRTAGTPARTRLRWMDVLRGSAILLVVLSHSTRVLADAVPQGTAMVVVDTFFEPYRMPMLMFLSGMLLPVALAKPLRAYYLGKVRRLAWPYAVWVGVLALIGAAPGPLTEPRTWYATSYLWYLFFLLCYFAVAPLVRRLPPPAVVGAAVALVLASVPLDAAADGRAKQLLYLGAFFALGHAAASAPRALDRLTASPRWIAVVAVALGTVPGVAAVSSDVPTLQGAFAMLSVLGILATIVIATAAVRTGSTRFLEWVGRNSIVFYVVHFPFLLLLARTLDRWELGWTSVGGTVAVAAAFTLSLGLGAALTLLRRVTIVAWLFEMPRRAELGKAGRAARVAARAARPSPSVR